MAESLDRDWANVEEEIGEAMRYWSDSRARDVQSRYLTPLAESSQVLVSAWQAHRVRLEDISSQLQTLEQEVTGLKRNVDDAERHLQTVRDLGRDLERQTDQVRDRTAEAERRSESTEQLLTRIQAVHL